MTVNIYVQNDCLEKLHKFLKEEIDTAETVWSWNNFKGAVSVTLSYDEYVKLIDISDKLDKEVEVVGNGVEALLDSEDSEWVKKVDAEGKTTWRIDISEIENTDIPEVYFEYNSKTEEVKFVRGDINSYRHIDSVKTFEFFIEQCMNIYNS